MSEYLLRKEQAQFDVAVFSGTTLRNYQRAAYQTESGQVFYDKTRNKAHRFKDFFFDLNITGTFRYAAMVADETSDIPVIMSGRVQRQYQTNGKLPEGFSFPVNTLWIPHGEYDYLDLLCDLMSMRESALEQFTEVNPQSLLLPSHTI